MLKYPCFWKMKCFVFQTAWLGFRTLFCDRGKKKRSHLVWNVSFSQSHILFLLCTRPSHACSGVRFHVGRHLRAGRSWTTFSLLIRACVCVFCRGSPTVDCVHLTFAGKVRLFWHPFPPPRRNKYSCCCCFLFSLALVKMGYDPIHFLFSFFLFLNWFVSNKLFCVEWAYSLSFWASDSSRRNVVFSCLAQEQIHKEASKSKKREKNITRREESGTLVSPLLRLFGSPLLLHRSGQPSRRPDGGTKSVGGLSRLLTPLPDGIASNGVSERPPLGEVR